MRSHDLDVLSLMAGVGFACVGLAALVGDGGLEARWTWPIVLILVGLVGLVASRRDTRR